jgi:hypothetical protein
MNGRFWRDGVIGKCLVGETFGRVVLGRHMRWKRGKFFVS